MQTYQNQLPDQDEWLENGCLGTGAFGTVTLWRNKFSYEFLAIKKCRLDLSPSNRQRWCQEVEILKKLDHPNIIKAKDVPPVLDVREGQLPLLAMEYCQGGDMRKFLNSPENIRGLNESIVIKVTDDIAHAIQFLHVKRIIHRDLKPENIVIQHMDGRDVYKLIDLGYAKQLDHQSLATSFVGSLRYLAPELLAGNGSYTKTVDYWSFGTVLFECITGIRPFPDLSPVNWHREIGQKSSKDIHAFYNLSDQLTFSEVFPELNSLSRCFQDKYIQLLQLLLLWNPMRRGGDLHQDGSRQCFKLVEDILNIKVVHIYCAFTSTLLTLEVTKADTREDINARVYEETGMAIDDQEIITSAGQEVLPESSMFEYVAKDNGAPSLMFLFSKSEIPKSPLSLHTLPATIQTVVTESKTLLPYIEQKRVHAEALSFCYKQLEIYQHSMQAHRTLLNYTKKQCHILSQLRTTLTSDCIRLEERIEFCKESLNTDIEHYSDIAVDYQSGDDTILRSWKDGERKWFEFDKSGIVTADKIAITAQTEFLNVQKHPFNQTQATSVNPIEEVCSAAVAVYDDFKKTNLTSYDQKMADCSQIADMVLKCLTKRNKLNKEMCSNLRKIVHCSIKLKKVIPNVREKIELISQHKSNLIQFQKQRQQDIWSLIFQKQSSLASGFNYPASGAADFSYNEDSSDLMHQSLVTIEKLTELAQSVKLEHDEDTAHENLDWSFLDVAAEQHY